ALGLDRGGNDAKSRPFEGLGALRAAQRQVIASGHLASSHLVPSHFLAAASALARSSGGRSDNCLSSSGSPLPAVFATRCHLNPSTLSTGVPMPLISTQASRFCAIALPWRDALRSNATAAGWFFGVPVPLKSAMAYSTSASTLSVSVAAWSRRTALSGSLGTPVPSL